ncbi:MAG: hypothetical protein IJ575_04030 [Selenomonadaceae bacterium]|nr:hypothetical protein [Selenomonadaceae bacterium]
MNRFLNFVSQMSEIRYEYTNQRIAKNNTPVALFAPRWSREQKAELIAQFQRSGIQFKYLFAVEPEEFEKPFDGIQSVKFAPPPRTIRSNLCF